jgi:hypothetical protein
VFRRSRVIAGAALVFGSALLAGMAFGANAAPLADGITECASVTASTRLNAVGYNHIVTLANHCERAVSCEVWTNVDPSPHVTLRAKPGGTADTITRVGSPSRDVHAEKLCHYE